MGGCEGCGGLYGTGIFFIFIYLFIHLVIGHISTGLVFIHSCLDKYLHTACTVYCTVARDGFDCLIPPQL